MIKTYALKPNSLKKLTGTNNKRKNLRNKIVQNKAILGTYYIYIYIAPRFIFLLEI